MFLTANFRSDIQVKRQAKFWEKEGGDYAKKDFEENVEKTTQKVLEKDYEETIEEACKEALEKTFGKAIEKARQEGPH